MNFGENCGNIELPETRRVKRPVVLVKSHATRHVGINVTFSAACNTQTIAFNRREPLSVLWYGVAERRADKQVALQRREYQVADKASESQWRTDGLIRGGKYMNFLVS